MSVLAITFLAGLFLIVVSIFGGGIEVKEVKIPNLGFVPRVLSFLLGGALLSICVFAPGVLPQSSQPPEPQHLISSAPNRNPDSINLTREFLIGRWEVEQASGNVSGGTMIDYRVDGTFAGYMSQFVNGVGQKQYVQGRWDFTELSQDSFQLTLQFENSQRPRWIGNFRVLDHNHVHNIDQNYVAIRL